MPFVFAQKRNLGADRLNSGFLDHVLRQGPSERMKLIKRTFFNNSSETMDLDNVTEAVKGIYSTIRLNEVCLLTSDDGE